MLLIAAVHESGCGALFGHAEVIDVRPVLEAELTSG